MLPLLLPTLSRPKPAWETSGMTKSEKEEQAGTKWIEMQKGSFSSTGVSLSLDLVVLWADAYMWLSPMRHGENWTSTLVLPNFFQLSVWNLRKDPHFNRRNSCISAKKYKYTREKRCIELSHVCRGINPFGSTACFPVLWPGTSAGSKKWTCCLLVGWHVKDHWDKNMNCYCLNLWL